jgi:hypothetical protein
MGRSLTFRNNGAYDRTCLNKEGKFRVDPICLAIFYNKLETKMRID